MIVVVRLISRKQTKKKSQSTSNLRVRLPFLCLNWRPDLETMKTTIIGSVSKARLKDPHFPPVRMINGSNVRFDWMFGLYAALFGAYGSH